MQIGTIRNSNAKRRLLFRPKKKNTVSIFSTNLWNFASFYSQRFQKFEILLAANYSFIYFFFKLAPRAMH